MLKKVIVFLLLFSFFASSAGKSHADPAQPGSQCRTLSTNGGFFFDNYEQHEYINNFLAIHMRLKTPYNDGRGWGSGFYLYKPDCSSQFFQVILPGFAARPKLSLFSIRFTSPTHFNFWDDEQDIQFDCSGICGGDIPAKSPDNSEYTEVSYHALETDASTIDTGSYPIQLAEAPKPPLLIIPGILGSVLSLNGKAVWPNLSEMVLDPQNKFMDTLDIDATGRPEAPNIQASDILGKIDYAFGTFDYSAGLISELLKEGYSLDKNLFIFPYDWRLGTNTNADLLKSRVAEIQKITASAKIDFLGHSLGGLVLKQFLTNNPNDNVNKVIFVATPHLGSADAARQLIFGSNLNIPLLSQEQIQKLSQNMPSIYELLPSREYFNHIPGYYDDLVDQRLKNILGYDQTRRLLENLGKNLSLLLEAENLHSPQFDNFDFNQKKYQVYNIVGCGTYTLKTINKMYSSLPSFLQKLLHGPKYRIYGGSGDGTVLTASAEHLNIPQKNVFYVQNVEHSKILSAEGSRQLIASLLLESKFNAPNILANSASCNVEGKLLSLSSAFDISVLDLQTNQPINPNLIRRIKVGEDQHLFFPTSSAQKYKIIAKPKDKTQFNYDISVSKINQSITTIYNYNQVKVDNSAEIQIDSGSTSVRLADQQGNLTDVPLTESFDQSEIDNALPFEVIPPDQSAQLPFPIQNQPPAAIIQPSQNPAPINYGSGSAIVPANGIAADPEAPASEVAPQTALANEESVLSSGQIAEAVTPANNALLPNININFQNPPNQQEPKIAYLPSAQPEMALNSEKAIVPSVENPIPAQGNSSNQTIIIDSSNSSSFYWNFFNKLLHLIFF